MSLFSHKVEYNFIQTRILSRTTLSFVVIKPKTCIPHERLKKNDPVSNYQKYKNSWQSQRAPGEKHHKELRWNVKEHMMYHDQILTKVTISFGDDY